MLWGQTERHLVSFFVCIFCFSAGIFAQGYESDDSTGSGGSGSTRTPLSYRSGPSNRINDSGDRSAGDVQLTTVRETLAEQDLNTPMNRPQYGSRVQPLQNLNIPLQNDISQTTNSFGDWSGFRSPGRIPDTYRTRDDSLSDTRYGITPLASRRGSTYDESQQPMQQAKLGKQFNIPNLQLNSPTNMYGSPVTTFRGYGNLNPADTARPGTSKKVKNLVNLGDEDDEPTLPTEADEDDITASYDNGTPNLDLSTPEGESFSLFQGPRSVNRAFPQKTPPQNPGNLKVHQTNPYVNSVTWFKPPSEESSELTKLEPVWQGEFLQPADAKGFLLTLLNALTDDLWVVAKGGFPYKGYNLFTQKFAEDEAARWIKFEGRLWLSGTKLVVYICIGGEEPSVLSLIEFEAAKRLEGKLCPKELGGGTFKSLGWGLRQSQSHFVDPRIEGTLYWTGATETGNLQSIFPPENDNRLWWTTKRAGGGRRRVPLVAFLGLPDGWDPVFDPGPETTDIQKLTRKLPYLARYKPVETDSAELVNRFEPGLWFKREFQLSGTFVNAAKTSTLVPWHIYVEETPKILFEPGKSSIDRYIVARPDGRETADIKPVTWRAKQVRPAGLGITQTRVYQQPWDKAGYQNSRFIYTCKGHGVYLRVGTEREARRECGQIDWIYSNFAFFVSYFSYKAAQDAHQEGTEMVFKPGDTIQGLRAMSMDKPSVRPTAARLYVVNGYNYVFDGKIMLHAEMFT
ncbi:hypothetical protein TWF281_007788 [Arthrobotrys megalospora]